MIKPIRPLLVKFLHFLVCGRLAFCRFFGLGGRELVLLCFLFRKCSRGDETKPVSLTAPITDTVDGSTKVPSLIGVEELSNFLASRISFYSLYEGVPSWAFCSGVKIWQNLHSASGVSTHGSFPFPLSLQCAQHAHGHNFLFLSRRRYVDL